MGKVLTLEEVARILLQYKEQSLVSFEGFETLCEMALRRLSQSTQPEAAGEWVRVPRELTEPMRLAAFPANAGKLGAQAAYRAMLSATPKQDQAQEGDQRARFEKWLETRWPHVAADRTTVGNYAVRHFEDRWEAWQAALKP